MPTSTLAAWAESGGPLAPLAARALPARDDDVTRGRIERLLKGSDPVVRAHVALGLGKDPEKDAVSLLASAYRFEDDAQVRASIVRALAQRKEVQRTETLEIARALDADDGVRALARAALAGKPVSPPRDAHAGGGLGLHRGQRRGRRHTGIARRADRPSGRRRGAFRGRSRRRLLVPGLSHQKYNLQL